MTFRIRSKLAAALVLPLLALVVLSGLLATRARAEADRVDAEADLAVAALATGPLTRALQAERTAAIQGDDPVATREVSAVAARELRDRISSDVGRTADTVAAALMPALEAFDALESVRDRAGETEARDAAVDALFDATAVLGATIDESAIRNGIELVDAANRRLEVVSRTAAAIVDVAGPDTTVPAGMSDPRIRAATAAAEVRLLSERIDDLATGPYAEVGTGAGTDDAAAAFESFLAGERVPVAALVAAVDAADTDVRAATIEVLVAEANRIVGDAGAEVRTLVIGAAIVVSLAIVIAFTASTSITRPLQALRREADDLAVRRLPEAVLAILDTPLGEDVVIPELEPIRIRTRDEVGDVVAALDDVGTRTLALAADQAVLRRNVADSFVNLGRRNQLLLDRQLEFITQLEQSETDPDQLEGLFRLDHLATRMRRNAESLLVLAGAESPRQWGVPVSITDVVRAGLGEVEEYQRVTIRHLDDAEVEGGAAAGLAHVLAELTENALSFSPPEQPVEVKGRATREGYVVAIADNGIGMTAHELDQANRRLSGQESYTVAPSRYLGHYVAGNLARQLGVEIVLRDEPAGGLVATVTIPHRILAGGLPIDAAPTATAPGPAEPAPMPTPHDAELPRRPITPVPARAADGSGDPVAHDGADDRLGHGVADERTLGEHDLHEHDLHEHDDDDLDDDDLDDPSTWDVPAGRHLAIPEHDPTDDGPGGGDASRLLDSLPERSAPAPWSPPASLADALAVAPDHPGDLVQPAPPSPPEPATPTPDGAVGPSEPTPADASGLPRRVPGAQRPDISPLGRRTPAAEPVADATATTPTDGAPEPAVAAADALGFLQAFRDDDATTEEDR